MQSFLNNIAKLEKLNMQYSKLCELLTYEEVVCDKKLFLKLEKEKRELEPVVLNFQTYNKQKQDLLMLEDFVCELDGIQKQIVQTEIENLKINLNQTTETILKQLNTLNGIYEMVTLELLFENSELAEKLESVIRKAYYEFCKINALNCEIEKLKNGSKLNIAGLNVKNIFSKFVGMHVAKLNGKEENVKVFVYEIDVETYGFNESDVEVSATRSSGAGGQHVNTTDSAIKVKHVKSGITVTCQNERSQLQNKNKAMELLKKKVEEFYKNKNESNITKQKKEQQKLFKTNIFVYDFNSEKITTCFNTVLNFSNFKLGKIQ